MFGPTDKVLIDEFIIDSNHTNQPPGINNKHPPLESECHVHMNSQPSTCQCPKSVSSWKFYLEELYLGMTTLFLTMPIVTFFTMIALLNTAKRRYMSTTILSPIPAHQRRLQELKVDEEITQDETYYARRWGYDCQQYNARTKDGYILKMYRFSTQVKNLDSDSPRKPVLIGHGLFQCSGDFVLNEKESLVFTLADQGYDVWTGNNCAVGSTEHTTLSQNDPCYWNWG
ncbi:unnamed protein product [Absidia cylindrospora]